MICLLMLSALLIGVAYCMCGAVTTRADEELDIDKLDMNGEYVLWTMLILVEVSMCTSLACCYMQIYSSCLILHPQTYHLMLSWQTFLQHPEEEGHCRKRKVSAMQKVAELMMRQSKRDLCAVQEATNSHHQEFMGLLAAAQEENSVMNCAVCMFFNVGGNVC